MVEVNRAAMRIARGDYVDARVVCERVLQEARPLNDIRVLERGLQTLRRRSRASSDAPRKPRSISRVAYRERAAPRGPAPRRRERARTGRALYDAAAQPRHAAVAQSRRTGSSRSCAPSATSPSPPPHRPPRAPVHSTSLRHWGQSIESKDRYTLGHCERVADYTCAMAQRRSGSTSRRSSGSASARMLHDVGKIVVPSEILNKPGPLSADGARDHRAPRVARGATCSATSSSRGTSCQWCADITSDGTAPATPTRWPARTSRQRAHPLRRRRVRRVDDRSAVSAGVPPEAALDAMRADRGRVFDPRRPTALRASRNRYPRRSRSRRRHRFRRRPRSPSPLPSPHDRSLRHSPRPPSRRHRRSRLRWRRGDLRVLLRDLHPWSSSRR